MGVVSIKYDEGSTEDLNYQSVELYIEEDERYTYSSGDFCKDWFTFQKDYFDNLNEKHPYLSASSSVFHFFSDGAQDLYDAMYIQWDLQGNLVFSPIKPRSLYGDDGVLWLQEAVVDLYVPKGMSFETWDEVKNYLGGL